MWCECDATVYLLKAIIGQFCTDNQHLIPNICEYNSVHLNNGYGGFCFLGKFMI